MDRGTLVQHLLDENGHRVLFYGPVAHPDDLSDEDLCKWHEADHAHEEGVGPRNGHTHTIAPDVRHAQAQRGGGVR